MNETNNSIKYCKCGCGQIVNGNKLDNRIENLACLPIGYHVTLHRKLREIEEQQKQVI